MKNNHSIKFLSSLAVTVALAQGAFAVPASDPSPDNNSVPPPAVADIPRPGQTVLSLSYGPFNAPAMPPSRVTVTAGDRLVVQSGNAPADWPVRWSRNGQPIPGATTSFLTLNNVNAADAGIYSATLNVPSGAPVITQTLFLDVTPVAPAPARRQTNLVLDFGDSTIRPLAPSRLTVAAGEYVLLQGTPESPPALVKWLKNNRPIGVTGNFLLLPNTTAADAGTYSATINLEDGRAFLSQSFVLGVGLTPRLANLSTRATVAAGAGQGVVSGFVVAGTGADKKMIVRAVGPSLSQFGLAHVLQRPVLRIYDASGKLYDNGYIYTAVQGGPTYETDLADSLTKSGRFRRSLARLMRCGSCRSHPAATRPKSPARTTPPALLCSKSTRCRDAQPARWPTARREMKRCDCYSPIDGSPSGGSPGDGPDGLIFMRALPLGGFVLAVILEAVFPLAGRVGWFPTPMRGFLAVVLLLTGLLLFVAGYLALSGAGNNAGVGRPAARVMETWPFSWSRHPMYLGLLVMFAGAGLAFRLYWMVLLLPLLLAICHYGVVMREEKYLERKFGLAYRNYQARVRRWI